MNATINAASLIIRNDIKVEGSDKPLFSIYEEGKDRAGLTFGLGKARKLAAILDDAETLQELRDKLDVFIGDAEAEETPAYTVEYDGKTYGLFVDGTIKRQDTRDGKTFWRLPKAGSKITTILVPEHFTGQIPLPTVEPANKVGRPAGSSNKNAEIEALKAANAETAAKLDQLLAMLAAKV